jgi:hypothetical protein
MKKWFKQQVTEFTAWAGLLLACSHLIPWQFAVALGLFFIAIDDDKAKAWLAKNAPWFHRKIDQANSASKNL